MNIRLIIVSILGIGVLAFSGFHLTSVIKSEKNNATNRARSTKINRNTLQHKSRFSGLNPELKTIAFRLENTAIIWQNNRPNHDNFHDLWIEWDDFSKKQILSLKTEQIKALAEWYYDRPEYEYTEFNTYRQALLVVS